MILLTSALYLNAFVSVSQAQPVNQITLNECYLMAEHNYPLVKQRELILKTSEYTIENIQKGYLPQLNINSQATYQSAVTQIPLKLPGVNISDISKDQYKLYVELNQVLYDGGIIDQQKQLQKANEATERQKLEAELYKLKERINQLFFGILLIDGQLKQNSFLIKDLQLGLNKIQAAINNGTALKSNANVLKADLLKSTQRNIELMATRKAYTNMLSFFINKDLNEKTLLVKPQPTTISQEINRPELSIYIEQNKIIDVQNSQLTARALPKLNLFFQGGVGRPALNLLNNDFDPYYIGGVRFTWSPSILYTLKKDRVLLAINKRNIDIQKETFLFNTRLVIKQQNGEINKYQELLDTDDEIISLRQQVKTASLAQLTYGVISANDYLREANAEDQARQNKILHEIQLLMSQYNQQTTTGNQQ